MLYVSSEACPGESGSSLFCCNQMSGALLACFLATCAEIITWDGGDAYSRIASVSSSATLIAGTYAPSDVIYVDATGAFKRCIGSVDSLANPYTCRLLRSVTFVFVYSLTVPSPVNHSKNKRV
jgi:hypothetical protein